MSRVIIPNASQTWRSASIRKMGNRLGGLNLKGIFSRDREPKRAAHRLREIWQPVLQPHAEVGELL